FHPVPASPGGEPPEVRDLEANAGTVFAANGGGGGKLFVINGDPTKNIVTKTFSTDGDVQTLGLTTDKTALFAGGHFTKINSPASPDNSRCQMFSISTASPYSIRP